MNKYFFPVISVVAIGICIDNTVRVNRTNDELKNLLQVKQAAEIASSRGDSSSPQSYAQLNEPEAQGHFIPGLKISGSYKYRNLEIFLLSASTELDQQVYTALGESFKKGGVRIHETSDVNNLQISNYSDQTVFINASEILSGGKQDRTVQYDMIIPPHVKRWSVPGFCVEQHRWEQRADEDVVSFKPSGNMLSSSELKEAAVANGNQSQVWSYAAVAMDSMSSNAKGEIGAIHSYNKTGSYHITLNDAAVVGKRDDILGELKKMGLKPDNSNGMAVAINGEIVSVDIYNNKTLFAALFDQLLSAAVYQTVSKTALTNVRSMSHVEVFNVIKNADDEGVKMKSVNNRTVMSSNQTGNYYSVTTMDTKYMKWLHRSWFRKVIRSGEASNANIHNNQFRFNLEPEG